MTTYEKRIHELATCFARYVAHRFPEIDALAKKSDTEELSDWELDKLVNGLEKAHRQFEAERRAILGRG